MQRIQTYQAEALLGTLTQLVKDNLHKFKAILPQSKDKQNSALTDASFKRKQNPSHQFLKKGSRKFMGSKISEAPCPKQRENSKNQIIQGVWLDEREFKQVYLAYCQKHSIPTHNAYKAIEQENRKLKIILDNQKDLIASLKSEGHSLKVDTPARKSLGRPQSTNRSKQKKSVELTALSPNDSCKFRQLPDLPEQLNFESLPQIPMVPAPRQYIRSLQLEREVSRKTQRQYSQVNYEDGRIRMAFKSGVIRDTLGSLMVVKFPNGDLKQILSDGTLIYCFKQANCLQIVRPNNERIIKFNEQTEIYFNDGSCEIEFGDGSRQLFKDQ